LGLIQWLGRNLGNAFNNRGTAYAKLKQFEKAIQDYNQAIELNPKDADAFIDRGVAYAKLKNGLVVILDGFFKLF
jgi:tetratricopeptide (TPR) repeat protein